MRHDELERFSRQDSPIHRLPAGAKLLAAVLLLLGIIFIPINRPWLYAVPALVLGLVAGTSRVPSRFLTRRLLFLEPFVLGAAALSLFQPEGSVNFVRLLVRGTLCLLTALLLSGTTPFSEILRVLQKLGLPSLMTTTLALMYRYLFVLVEESERMSRARAGRTFAVGRNRLWWIRAGIVGRLFTRSAERAERIYAAMCARGWKA